MTIAELEDEVAALWQEASYATSGGEGMAGMSHVRAAQARLVAAHVAAAGSEPAERTAHLTAARETALAVLLSDHGPDHAALLAPLRAALADLGLPPAAHDAEIRAAWVAIAAHAERYGRPEDARTLEQQIRQLLGSA